MLSRRTFLQILELIPAALVFGPAAAVASVPKAPEPEFVIVGGWVLRRDDLAALPGGATALR